ncbi:hypothetical protein CJ030_MR4G003842 [Morella rubra]|uniref:Uncharacterized protein n=1 Tax=Morella rubra TaxID=262757 RepID=A0A6A1VYU0_9ROSI|nr:hypothetical protein CJ030_MR4G003842 [Morella rubra]
MKLSAWYFQNRMPLSMIVGGVQETHSLSWFPNDDNQRVMRPSEPNFLPLRYVECSSDVSFPGYSGHFSTDNSVEVTKMNSGGGSVDDLSRTACLNVKFGEQYAYPLYNSSDLPDDKKLMPEMEMNSLENPVDFQVYSNFEPPRSLCDRRHQTWFSSSGPCAIAIYNQNAYQQVRISFHSFIIFFPNSKEIF